MYDSETHWGYMYISPFVCANAATAIFSQALPAGRPGNGIYSG